MNAQQDSYGNYSPIQTPQAPGNTPTSNAGGIIVGSGNPNGVVTALPGSVYFDETNLLLYGTNDGMTWSNLSSGGGSGTQQVYAYTSGTPTTPSNISLPAVAYDPTGNLPLLGWSTTSHTWG